jgi:alkaline phosphatase D
MTTSKANWNVLVQPTLFAPQQQSLNGAPAWHSDGWDGYPHARQWVIDLIARSRLSNPLIVGGDVHAHYVAQVHAEPENPKSTLVASEFCGTSISAQGLPADVVSDMVKNNPHILLGRSDTRGYQIHQVDEKRTRVKLVHTLDVKEPLTGSQTLAQFEVRAGSPRINRL